MLVTMKEQLLDATESNKAVAAINVSNMESITALLEVAERKNRDVIIQVAPIQIETHKISYKQVVNLIKVFEQDYNVRASIHLDHATSVEACYKAIDAGFTSVMFDGSLLDYKQNIEHTKKVVAYAKDKGITVEAELGKVGGTEGKEESDDSMFTDPRLVKEFIDLTGIDCLAVSIGNAHGIYKCEPNLDFHRLEEINNIAGIPLVLHGCTGISGTDLDKAISLGIRKINVFTEIDREYVKGFVDSYLENNSIYMMAASENGRQRMMKMIEEKIDICSRIA